MFEFARKWESLSVGDKRVCADIQVGFACGKKDIDEGVPHLRMNNISSDGTADFSLVRRVPKEIADKKNRWLKPGDVIFCNTNSTELVGKTCLFTGWKEPCSFSNHLTRLRANRERILPEWLSLCLRRLWLFRYFAVHCTEFIGQSAFNKDKLETVEIPVPYLEEQSRIVMRIEELTCRADEARRLGFEIEDALDLSMKAAYYRMIEGVRWKPLKEVASIVRREIHTKPDEEYEEMGVRSFGKGTFRKPILTGRQIGSKRIYRIHEGDLVFNNVFAWEGAIGVAQPEDHGRVGSHRFITYVPHQEKATSEFLCYHFLSGKGLEDICAASPGSAGRNRTLGLEKLKIINVPVPDYQKQLGFAEIAKRRHQIQRESTSIRQELMNFGVVVIEKAFRGEL